MTNNIGLKHKNQPVAFVLGGSIPHLPLIAHIKKMGYYCILIDYLDDPKGKEFADLHLQISTLDKKSVLEQAIKYDAQLVISLCLDQPMNVACYVSEKLNLPIPYSYQTSLLVTDKVMMKKQMLNNDIPTSRFVSVTPGFDMNEIKRLSLPLIVKPSDSTGSLGVYKVSSYEGLNKAIEQSLNFSRNNHLIIEEFVDGREWNIYLFVVESVPNLIMILEKIKHKQKDAGFQQIGSYTIPVKDNPYVEQILSLAKKICLAFSVQNGPLLIQAKINQNSISVIEIAARLGGTALSNAMIKDLLGIDIVRLSINSYIGRNVAYKPKATNKFQVSNFVYARKGTFNKVTGLNTLKKAKIVSDYFVLKQKGNMIPEGISSKNRVAAFYVTSDNKETAYNKLKEAINQIDVLDITGQSILLEHTNISKKPQE